MSTICREVSADTLSSARTLEDMYTSSGVQTSASGERQAPPTTFIPPGTARSSFPYLTGADGRAFDLSSLYANDRAALTCLLQRAGYNETRAREIEIEVQRVQSEQPTEEAKKAAVDAHIAGLSVLDQRTYSIFKTLRVVEYFRGAGNKDGNQNVIAAREIEGWAWAVTKRDEAKFREMGGQAIARIHALLGLAHFLGTEPPAAAPAAGAAVVCECTEETVRIDTLLQQLYDCDQELDGKQADIDQKLDDLVTCNEENGRLDAEMTRLQGENASCQARLPVAEGDLALCEPDLLMCQVDYQEEAERRQFIETDYLFCWSGYDAQAMEMARLQRENEMLRMAAAACEGRPPAVPPPPLGGPGTDLPGEPLPGGVPAPNSASDAGIPRLE